MDDNLTLEKLAEAWYQVEKIADETYREAIFSETDMRQLLQIDSLNPVIMLDDVKRKLFQNKKLFGMKIRTDRSLPPNVFVMLGPRNGVVCRLDGDEATMFEFPIGEGLKDDFRCRDG